MKKLSLFVVLAAAAVLLLSACSPKSAEATTATPQAAPQGLIAEGRLVPVNSLDQAFTIPGQVAEVLVQDGESVRTGQPLARLSISPDAQAALARAEQEVLAARQALDALESSADVTLAQARLAALSARDALDEATDDFEADDTEENQARLDAAQANFDLAEDRLATLEDNQGVDPDLLAAAEARLNAAEAVLASAQALIDAHQLKAVLNGNTVDVDLQSGQLVAAGVPALTVADYSTWLVETDNLTELEVVGISLGQKVEVVLDALPETTLQGEVTHINARYEEKRGDITFTITIRLSQTDPQMRWGMTAAVSFLP